MKKEINIFEHVQDILQGVKSGVLLTTCSEGKANTMTISWGALGIEWGKPVFTTYVRESRFTREILDQTGEFTINIPYGSYDKNILAFCGSKSGRDVDKFKEMNLTPLYSDTAAAPSIKESPVNIFCRVTQVIPLGSHDVFLAEVTGITVDKDYMDEKGKFHLNSTGLVAYSHGEYFQLGEKLGKFGYSVQKK